MWPQHVSTAEGWTRLARLTTELVGQDDESVILRAALEGSPSLFGCDRVEIWLHPAQHRPAVRASVDARGTDPVEVRVVERVDRPTTARTLCVPLPGRVAELGSLRLVGCPLRGRRERERLAVGFGHLLSSSLGAAHALGQERLVARESTRRAHHDGLTSLGNRWLLQEWGDHLLALAEARSRTAALLLFDVDGFKQINDTLGHDAGDQVLAELGRRIHHSVRENDLAVRLGGDEFAVLTDDLPAPAGAEQLAERLLEAMSRPMLVDDTELRVVSSVGIAVHGVDADNVAGLLRAADQAMYVAKGQGAGHWHRFLPSDPQPGNGSERLLEDISRGSLDQQLVLHYQPQLDLATGHLRGFEALARWSHPELGLLAPREFIPMVERSGRMRQLTAHVLDRALAELAALARVAPEASMAVNISPRDLIGHGLVPEVSRLLAEHGVAADRLTLEVTEPTTGSAETEVLAGLERLGCPVSVSEYGTGPSSLTALAQHRGIREVKLDSTLVGQLPADASQRLVRAIVSAAHGLGVTVVAEGVESAAAAEEVRALGCDVVQGTFIHPPVPSEEVAAWLRGPAVQDLLRRAAG